MAEGGSDNGHPNDLPDDYPNDEKPDDIKKLTAETEVIFKDFILRRLKSRSGFEDSDMSVTNIPPLEALDELDGNDAALDPDQQRQFEEVGRTLRDFGDVVQERYSDVFTKMISKFNLVDNEADFVFEKFSVIARKLFEDGINWGRIVALLCFGYQLSVHCIRRGTRTIQNFLKKIVTYVIQFLVKENIINWMVRQGGWLVGFVRDFSDPSENSSEIWMKRLGALAVIAAVGYGCYRYSFHGQP